MEEVHSKTPALLDDSLASSDFVEHMASLENEDGNLSDENLGININNLPEEVLAMIFMDVDSITRKKIESVCKTWLTILRGVKALRTHVKIDIVDLISRGIELPHCCTTVMENLITLETKLLHLNGSGEFGVGLIDVLDLDDVKRGCNRDVDILLTNTEVVIPFDISKHMKAFKRVILRNVDIEPTLEVYYLQYHFMTHYCGTLSFGELHLDLVDDPHQLAKIYFNQAGPLTKSRNEDLKRLINTLSTQWLEGYERIGLDVDLRAMLADVAAGRNIPRFIAEVLTAEQVDSDEEEE